MSNLNKMVADIKAAADELKTKVAELDARIADAHKRRDAITREAVSKDDFMAYIREDIRAKGARFGKELERFTGAMKKEYPTLEQMMQGGSNVPYLTIDRSLPTLIKEEAVYWYFGDLIADRFADAVDGLDWPHGVLPVAERKAITAKIDGEIATLRRERDELASQLIEAGLAG